MAVLLRTFSLIVLAGATSVAGWWTIYWKDRLESHKKEVAALNSEISSLHNDIQEKDEQIEQLDTALQLLKIDRRIARIEVLEQGPAADNADQIETTLRFQELGPQGEPLGPAKILTIRGKTAYVDTLVIKFGDEYVEQGDILRGTSICLFRRIFGEDQTPNDGVALDPSGVRPIPYSPEVEDAPAQSHVWGRFWDYANDINAAEKEGIRAIHGEAPFMEMRPGKSYKLELRASDGLSIVPEN